MAGDTFDYGKAKGKIVLEKGKIKDIKEDIGEYVYSAIKEDGQLKMCIRDSAGILHEYDRRGRNKRYDRSSYGTERFSLQFCQRQCKGDNLSLIHISGKAPPKMRATLTPVSIGSPVSYTHLDVYKRQR